MNPAPFEGDGGRRAEGVHGEEGQDVDVALRPGHAKAFQRPESTERGQQRSHHELQETSWNPGYEAFQRKSDSSDDDDRSCGAGDGKAQLAGGA
jgi:hypothetical protein